MGGSYAHPHVLLPAKLLRLHLLDLHLIVTLALGGLGARHLVVTLRESLRLLRLNNFLITFRGHTGKAISTTC